MSTKFKNDYQKSDVLPSTGTRLAAIIIDGIILGAVTGLLFGSAGNASWGIGFVMTLTYNWFFWTRWEGQTPGKRIMGLRVVKMDGSPIRDIDALIRATGYYVNTMFMMIGWIWALFDSNHRGWHDLFAGTLVIHA